MRRCRRDFVTSVGLVREFVVSCNCKQCRSASTDHCMRVPDKGARWRLRMIDPRVLACRGEGSLRSLVPHVQDATESHKRKAQLGQRSKLYEK